MSEDRNKIEALRKELFLATANRALVYAAILEEMRKEFGEERASEIFKRAIYNHGVNMARMFAPPETIEQFRDWLLGFFPDDGAMQEPQVVQCDEEQLVIKLRRCPLKEAWRMSGLREEEVADLCRHADSFDHGFFGSFFDYSMDLWENQPDDACVLHFRSRKKNPEQGN